MADEVRRFTNIPGREGFEFVPEIPSVEGGEIFETGGAFTRTPITERGLAPPGERPSDADLDQLPDFSRRDDFEKSVFETLGENPFEINPNEVVREMTLNLEPLFNHVFKGRVHWSDRHELTEEQNKWWSGVVKSYRAQIHEAAISKKNTLTEQYRQMMSNFDVMAKEQQQFRRKIVSERETRAEEKRTEERKIAGEERAEERKIAAEKRAEERLTERGKRARREGRQETKKEPTSSELKRVFDFQSKTLKDQGISKGDQIPSRSLNQINAMRRSVGMNELEEVKISEAVPGGLFGFGEQAAVFEYREVEEVTEEPPTEPLETEPAPIATTRTSMDELKAAEPQVKRAFPDAKLMRNTQGEVAWYATKDGKTIKLNIRRK